MHSLELKIPPPIVMLLCGSGMWVVSIFASAIELDIFIRNAIVIFSLVLGACLGFSGVWEFRKASTTINPHSPQSSSSLVISGIYQTTRNPMYLGLFFFLLAWGMYLLSLWSFCFLPIFILYITRFQIKPEEKILRQVFGAEFDQYAANVRRWL